jgi:hypothetical protein
LPAAITSVFHVPCVEDFYDLAANERMRDRGRMHAYNLMRLMDGDGRDYGLGPNVPLPPNGFVSKAEIVHSLALSERIGYEVLSDQEEPFGLRLALWVRGYAALAAWAEQAGKQMSILRVSDEELVTLLMQVSFSETQARLFLDTLAFGKNARDLFDAPLIRICNEWVVVGPAIVQADFSKIIPSMLSKRGVQLKQKGHAFNDRVLRMLKEQGLDARTITVKRGGEEYDYDVLVPWGDYLFLFECKNHGLSGNDPGEAMHFLQELESTLGQVKRLRRGLETFPDILHQAFGPEIAAKKLIPCILHNETYARAGEEEGIYVYDFSALSRFFESRAFHMSQDHRLDDGRVVRVQADALRIWAGDYPTPEYLLAQLEHPFQLKLLADQLECKTVIYGIGSSAVVFHDQLLRRPPTMERVVVAAGGDPDAVRAVLDAAGAKMAELKTARPREGPS